ncbi:MAG: VOC family protein [Egibacteraceae bacterium]
MSTEFEVPIPTIDRSIYAMPAFATLTVADIETSVRWYTEGLGFVVLASMPAADGTPMLVHLRRYRHQDLLIVPARDASEPTGAGPRLSFAAPDMTEHEAAADRASALGLGDVEGPAPTPWFTVDTTFTDPDGYEVVFTSRSDEAPPREWNDAVRASLVE